MTARDNFAETVRHLRAMNDSELAKVVCAGNPEKAGQSAIAYMTYRGQIAANDWRARLAQDELNGRTSQQTGRV